MIVYIAGPMKGFPNLNFDAFKAAKERIEQVPDVQQVWCPASVAEVVGNNHDLMFYIRLDLNLVMSLDKDKDLMVLLPGWENSTGAQAERHVAQWMGVTTIPYDKFLEIYG